MGDEIERKFLIEDIEAAVGRAGGSEPIKQGYLAVDPAGLEVRVRRRGDSTVLTAKRGAGAHRDEVELEIGDEDFERLWELTEGRRIQKRRHYIEAAGATIELDVFAGELAGLAVAEVEFDSVDAAEAFEPPDWFGRELTGDESYSNAALALGGDPAAGG